MTKRKKILFWILVIVTPFMLLEMGLRLVGYTWQFPYQDHPDLGYQLKPHYSGFGADLLDANKRVPIQTNGLGLRGPQPKTPKPPGLNRIAALGDACTFGIGLAYGQTYPALSEKMLNDVARANLRFEIINAGIPGYTSYQALALLKQTILPLQPDLLIVYFGWNDHAPADRQIPDQENMAQMRGYILKKMAHLQNNPLRQLRIYQGLTSILLGLQDRARQGTAIPGEKPLVYRVGLREFKMNLIKIVTLAKQHKIPTILITAPYAHSAKTPQKNWQHEIQTHQTYNQATREAAQASGAILLDMARFFRETNPESLLASDGMQPNAAGQRILAQELVKTIKSIRMTQRR